MRYENHQPPEGINVTPEHPLRQFLRLLVAALVLLGVIVVVLQFAGAWLAKRVPFALEERVVSRLDIDFGDPDASPEALAYLRELGERLMAEMVVADGIEVTVHYSDEDVFNAFATVGGNLLFYRGLLERMPHENALAMVLAHEIAHVLHRDPLAGLGGGVASAVALALLTGNAGTGVAGEVLGRAGVLSGMSFTRRMEREADRAALGALVGLYGHTGGAEALFEMVAAQRSERRAPDWLERFTTTHPLDADRIAAIAERAAASGWATTGPLTPLPDDFASWLGEDG